MSNKEPLDLSKLTQHDFKFIKKLTHEQEDFVNKLFKHKRVIVDAMAGSGKTTVSTQAMLALYKKEYIEKIYYVVFPVQEGALGFLPGEVGDKIKEYAVPFAQSLIKAGVNPQEANIKLMCDPDMPGDFKVVPHTFLRGRTIEKAGVIADEVQNGTRLELKKTLTRLEDCCYLAAIGHNGQIDIPKDLSGFSSYIHHFKRGKETGIFTGIEFAKLTHNHRGDFSSFADQIGDLDFDTEKEPQEDIG